MDTDTHPGSELSLSQLVFALNNELKRTIFSPSCVAKNNPTPVAERHSDFPHSYSLDRIVQLDRDTSSALAAIREWRNSFVPINRIPLDVLSLIPTYLEYKKDRFRATFVCRHWRRTFLGYGALWSTLFLEKGEDYVKTILERVKESPLDITIGEDVPIDRMISLLSPHTRQIRRLKFRQTPWAEVIKFSALSSAPFSLLRTLGINPIEPEDIPDTTTSSSSPLFCSAVNVEEFVMGLRSFKLLNSFAFPHLTTFELFAIPTPGSNASDLFNFLRASPTLRTVKICISGPIVLGDTPQEPIVILPNVEGFFLTVTGSGSVYDTAVRISCPRSVDAWLMHDTIDPDAIPDNQQVFPPPALSSAIVRQYTSSPVEEVRLEVAPPGGPGVRFFITFYSSDASVVAFRFTPSYSVSEELHPTVLLQSFRSIRAHSLLSRLKRLHIKCGIHISEVEQNAHVAEEIGGLFKSLGPLDELTIDGCDLKGWYNDNLL